VRSGLLEWLWSLWTAGGLGWLAGVVVAFGRAVLGIRGLPHLTDPAQAAAPRPRPRRRFRRSPAAQDSPPPDPPGPLPPVSVVVAARNEAATLRRGVGSILASDYPHLEVVVVDDRSSDGTGEILQELTRSAPRADALRVLRIRSLPPGWLGKNHALQRGAEAARGEWLLFTDADVYFAPGAIRTAVAMAERAGLDHLTVVPVLRLPGMPLRLFLAWVLLVYTVWTRPWNAAHPRRRGSAGVGAFNLVRREAYWAVGGHAAIPLALADDVALGARLKGAGFRQALALAARPGPRRPGPAGPEGALLEVQWYPNLRAAIRGFEKNAFALFRFRALAVAAWSLGAAAGTWGPLLAALLAPGWHRLPWAVSYLLTATMLWYAGLATAEEFPWTWGLLFPVGQTLLIWTVLRSAGVALRQGGVRWRDTFYPLAELRAAVRAGRA
jgi:glycosyltransferase involved in cell wall biosynthesis